MQQLNSRHDSGAGASVPCCTLRQWVSLCSERLFRQEQEQQEHLHLDENTTVRGGGEGGMVVTRKGKGLSSKGKLHARNFHTMNKFTSNQHCHSLIERISWRRWVSSTFRDKGENLQWVQTVQSVYPSFCLFHSVQVIWSVVMMRGETGQSQREKTFNLGEITKGRTKDSSGWQDAPGATMLLLCWKGAAERCGAIRDRRIEWGEGPGTTTLPNEVFSAQRIGGTTLPDMTAVALKKKEEEKKNRHSRWWWIYELQEQPSAYFHGKKYKITWSKLFSSRIHNWYLVIACWTLWIYW